MKIFSKTKIIPILMLSLVVIIGFNKGNASADKGAVKTEVKDNRELLAIPFKIRNKLLHKMNNENLGSLGEMLEALSKDDLAEVARVANKMSFSGKTEKFSVRRGSLNFALMATDFHGQKMPAIREAAEKGDRQEVLRRMSEAVQACMGCHAANRLVEWPTDRSYPNAQPVKLPDSVPEPKRKIPNYKYKKATD